MQTTDYNIMGKLTLVASILFCALVWAIGIRAAYVLINY